MLSLRKGVKNSWVVGALIVLTALSPSVSPAKPLALRTSQSKTEMLQQIANTGICRYCKLPKANFAGQDLQTVDFRNADLRGANFRGANLVGVIFAGADLSGADLSEADLRGADFTVARLNGTYICNANLVGVNFSGTNMIGTDLTGSDITSAKMMGLMTAVIMPNGVRTP